MTHKQIKDLLTRYYEGNTSADEERTLRNYFLQEEVPKELSTDKELFKQLETMHHETFLPSDDFEARLTEALHQAAKSRPAYQHRFPKIKMRTFVSIAASFLLLFILGVRLYFHDTSPAPIQKDTFTNPEDAVRETERVLQLFATTIRQGEKGICKVAQATTDIKEQLNSIKIYKK